MKRFGFRGTPPSSLFALALNQLKSRLWGNPAKPMGLGLLLMIVSYFIVPAGATELTELSLEELMNLEITSVAKKTQALSEVAAAVFVITQDDIRRSGVTSIPEALRLAPGVQVARVDANKWAIGIRGFNNRFNNKLLVLIDGRSVYTPLYGGVFWDVQDTLLEDIDRIEVIRGPGAAVWGANAVNGVINIITKTASATQGGLLSAGAGDEERGFVGFRYGGEFAEGQGHYRVYGKYFDRAGSVSANTGNDLADDWHQARAGFRMDWANERDNLTAQGDIYQGKSGQTVQVSSPGSPSSQVVDADDEVKGGNVLLRWQRTLSSSSDWSLQFYYDRTERLSEAFEEEFRNIFDVEFQHRFLLTPRQDFIWGLGYRYASDKMNATANTQFSPPERGDHLFSAFVQNDIAVVPDRWRLTLGSKFEHNDYSGFEIQPNIRVLWTPDERRSGWLAISRAVRTPTRAEHDAFNFGLAATIPPRSRTNPFPIPLVTTLAGSDQVDSEESITYELGFRMRATPQLQLDFATFYSDYDDLVVLSGLPPRCEPSGQEISSAPDCLLSADFINLPFVFDNGQQGESYGFEMTADWRPRDNWRLQAHYSYLRQHLPVTDGNGLQLREGWNPRHQASLFSTLSINDRTDWSIWFRYVDTLSDLDIDSYLTLDTRLAWRPWPGVELSLTGQNLLDGHQEFISELNDLPATEIQRSVYGQLRWEF